MREARIATWVGALAFCGCGSRSPLDTEHLATNEGEVPVADVGEFDPGSLPEGALPPVVCTSESQWVLTLDGVEAPTSPRMFGHADGGATLFLGSTLLVYDPVNGRWAERPGLSPRPSHVDFDERGNGWAIVGADEVATTAHYDEMQRRWTNEEGVPQQSRADGASCDFRAAGNRALLLWRRPEENAPNSNQSSRMWATWRDGPGGWRSSELQDEIVDGAVLCHARVAIGVQLLAGVPKLAGMFVHSIERNQTNWSRTRISNPNVFSGSPRLEADRTGNVSVAWHEQTEPFTPEAVSSIWFNRSDGERWSEPREITKASKLVVDLELATTDGGYVVVVWREAYAWHQSESAIHATVRLPQSGQWAMPIVLTPVGRDVTTAMTPGGSAFVAWSDSVTETVHVRRFDAATASWEPEVELESGVDVSLATAGDGSAFIASGDRVWRYGCLRPARR